MSDDAGVPAVDVQTAIAGAGWLLDVREEHEWNAGHAPDAHWIPMSRFGEHVDELPASERILVICRSGARSATVTEALRDAGYDAVNVEGGMLAWQSAEGVLVAEGDAPPRI